MASFNQYDQRIADYQRKQKLAEQLRATEMPQGQMVGQHYVAANPLGQIGAMLRQYTSMELEDKAQKGIESTRAEQGQALKDWQAQMPKMRQETVPGELINDTETGLNFNAPSTSKTVKPTAEDYMAWGQQGMAIDPAAAQMGMQGANMQLTRESNQAARESQIASALAQAKERSESNERIADMNIQGRKEQAKLAQLLRPAPQEKMVSVIGPDGQTPVLVPQHQAAGMTPFAAGGAKAGSPAMQQKEANDAISLLKQSAPLINKSTNSGIGAGVDYLMSLGGGSTAGADQAAELKVLGGMLVAKMPKMSGPQSDKDVLLYKEMAGRIGDPTIPASQKKKAMEAINEIQARYAGVDVTPLDFGDAKKPSSKTGAKFLGFE